MNKRNKILATLGIIIALPAGYFAGGYRVVDMQLVNMVNSEIEKITENKYTGSIKDGTSVKQVGNIKNYLKWIHNSDLKKAQYRKTNAIVKQADLQSKTTTSINKYYKQSEVDKIKSSEVEGLMKKSNDILNDTVKSRNLRRGSEVIDRVARTQTAIKQVDDLYKVKNLSQKNLPAYYSADAIASTAYGDKTKKNLAKKLKQIKSRLDKALSDSKNKEDEDIKKTLEAIEKGSVTFSGGDNEVYVRELSKPEFAGVVAAMKTGSGTAIVLTRSQAYLFTVDKGQAKTQGNFKVTLTNLATGVYQNYSKTTQRDSNGNPYSAIVFGPAIIGANSSANAYISADGYQQLNKFIKENTVLIVTDEN